MLLAQVLNEPAISEPFLWGVLILAVGMLLWDTIEVGRNDAANIVNAVFGARILTRERAVLVAGIGVVLGASLSSGVMDTARKGIFNPAEFHFYKQVLTIYISVYVVDTILLYSYSAFGMPVSTTMTLVFELLGASFFMGWVFVEGKDPVNWDKAGDVIQGIIWSIILSAILGYILMRISRWLMGPDSADLRMSKRVGVWIAGGLLAILAYFMVVKGMKEVTIIGAFKKWLGQAWIVQCEIGSMKSISLGETAFVLVAWLVFGGICRAILGVYQEKAAKLLFPVLTVIGMLAMAFAFGQNDLANAAAPGLAAVTLTNSYHAGESLSAAIKPALPQWALFGCGILLVLGMSTKHAQRVTRAEVNTGSAGATVRLWAPQWCIYLAKIILKLRPSPKPSTAPKVTVNSQGKTVHYDPLRGSIIMSVSASVIATASALKLPVSTTYVAFAAVLSTGAADRIFARGDAALKMARFIWVVFSWFMAAVIAAVMAGFVALLIYQAGVFGMVLCIGANLVIRRTIKRRSDAQEERVKREAAERRHPEEYALEDED
ncbi:MAG TPA: inorganic phosphate transporter [Phycisphaerae bacterium]|nr:inorganic phosphate transporter [Phycisphaerae bacterium]HRW55357.1 inorganic phosphate transporter [Phycisphaerae bacterium]